MLSFALWVKETHTWLLSRSILLVLIWAYTSFTRNYRSTPDTFCVRSVNHDHANALITWAAWLVYSSIVELTPDTFPDSLGVVISILSVFCVIISIHVENDRHSKKDGLRRTDWIVLQTTRGLFLGLLFMPHRSTLLNLGWAYTACVSVLFFLNFAVASLSTDMDQKAPLYIDCKLIQSVWVLVGDIRITAITLPYVLFKLNKIRWLKTGDGWAQNEYKDTCDCEVPSPDTEVHTPSALTSIGVVKTNESSAEAPRVPGGVPPPAPIHKETLMKLQQAIALSNNKPNTTITHHPTQEEQVTLFSASSDYVKSTSQRTSLISHLQALSTKGRSGVTT